MKINETISKLHKKYNCPIWIDSQGMLIPVKLMEETHLLNAYKMLDRERARNSSAINAFFHPIWGPRGEMAELAAEQEMEHIYERQWVIDMWMKALGAEITRRGMEMPEAAEVESLPKIESVEQLEGGLLIKIKKEN